MTIKITEERQYIDRPDCCVYIQYGEYVYQDMFGHKVFKTIKGLNRRIKSECEAANIPVVSVC